MAFPTSMVGSQELLLELINKCVGLIRPASNLAASRPLRSASTDMYWHCISFETDLWTVLCDSGNK